MLREPMRRAAALLVVILSCFGLTANASEPPRPDAVLSLIPFDWHALNYEIAFLGPRVGIRAMTFPSKHKIEVYVRSGDDPHLIAFDIAHELGHAIDFTYNTAESRKNWMAARGIDSSAPWFGCNQCSDFDTPAGDFAETFALLVYGPEYFRGRIASAPQQDKLQSLRRFFPAGIFQADAAGVSVSVTTSPDKY